MNNKYMLLFMACSASMVFGVVTVDVVGLAGKTLGSFELENATVLELQAQIQEKLRLNSDHYELIHAKQSLTENYMFTEDDEPTVQLIRQIKVFMPPAYKSAYRGNESLTPKGYADVIYKLEIDEYILAIDTKFFDVNPESAFAKWKNKSRIKLSLDEYPGNFVIMPEQGYDLHNEVMEFLFREYDSLLKNEYYGCLYDDFENNLFIWLDRQTALNRDINKVFTARYICFDDMICWALCTLAKNKLKPEIPVLLILNEIVSVIHELYKEDEISEAEVHKRFYKAVLFILEEYVREKTQAKA